MMRREDSLLHEAVEAMSATDLDNARVTSSAQRVAGQLGIDDTNGVKIRAIESCADVQNLLGVYHAGSLPVARALLIEAHLRECVECRRRSRSGVSVDWSAPRAQHAFALQPRTFGWALASCVAVLACTLFLYRTYWEVPPGVRAEVQSIDGSAYAISDTGNRLLAAGDQLKEGERLRTDGGSDAVLRLTDGSTVEVNQRSVLRVGARGHNMTVMLDGGAVIVQAAKRDFGHLYVKTPDCRVAVTGTVFSVDAGIKGSRVAVLQGSVHVMHAGMDTVVGAGGQVSTSSNLSPAPVAQQIAWSRDREKYLPLLAQLSTLQHRIQAIPMPDLRYTSDLLNRVPLNTALYISIPNLGDFISEANQIFHDQLQKSATLQQWWNRGQSDNSGQLDALVAKLHEMSRYLGDEIVIDGVREGDHSSFAIIADVKTDGLGDFLNRQFPATQSKAGIVVLNPATLAMAGSRPNDGRGAYALIRQHEAVFSNSLETLRLMNAQLNTGNSGFAAGDFGQHIEAAYKRGAGILVAVDLQGMINGARLSTDKEASLERSGMNDVRFLIAEHREVDARPENRVKLQFAGPRQELASWLAAPAPIGSLEFVSPNAALAMAMLSKDPRAIADDLLKMADADKGEKNRDLNAAEARLHINFRDDIAANLSGDFLVALDGPVLPIPAWKAVIGVRNPVSLEQSLERFTESLRNAANVKSAHSIEIQMSNEDGRTFYALRDLTTGNIAAEYTFANGYLIVAPTRAIVMDALHTYTTGDSLARSTAFRELLPKDENENYSAILYQNLGPQLGPLLSKFSGDAAAALQQLAADERPTVICARGEQSRIDVASDSHLFGFDFLALDALTGLGNKHRSLNVLE